MAQNQNSTITVEPAFKDTIQEEEQRQSIESGSALSQNIIDQEKLTSVPKNMLYEDKIRGIGEKLPGRLSAVKSSDASEATDLMYRKEINTAYGYSLVSDNARVYKGGSWRDIPYWSAPASRRYLDEDEATDYIGFRCAMARVGSQTKGK